ncbi:zf-HC2 domain-containing protein [Leucobacter sp. 1207-22]|uniref:zf-HC2 domain-containing protein n=1 Tax=Leucobacter sp. 1207-22 TaxID=2604456 RepID=UPI004064C181
MLNEATQNDAVQSDATPTEVVSDCGCESARAKLYEWLRGELCSEESAPIREHLSNCANCQGEKSVCESLTEVVKRVCEDERADCAPADLRDAILRGLQG